VGRGDENRNNVSSLDGKIALYRSEYSRLVIALPLTPEHIPNYVATYAPPERRAEVSRQIAPLVKAGGSVSPLFVRFAIEQALKGQVTSTGTLGRGRTSTRCRARCASSSA
jgi:hypothetical protein